MDKNWDTLCYGKTRTPTWNNTIVSSLSSHKELFQSGNKQLGLAGYWALRGPDDPPAIDTPNYEKIKKRQHIEKDRDLKESKFKKEKKEKKDKLKIRKPKIPKSQPVAIIANWKIYYTPLPQYIKVCLAKENSAPQIKISSDLTSAQNDKGYRMVRASHGVMRGVWYYEAYVISPLDLPNAHTRLGWSTEKGDLQAPVGYDQHSYAYRDIEGTIFHQSVGNKYGEPYGVGDVIGFLISLPSKGSEEPIVVPREPVYTPIPKSGKEELEKSIGSKIIFYKNGVYQGVAFVDIFDGTYYPAASLYMGATVRLNFGPEFKYKPDISFRPMCESVSLFTYPPIGSKTEDTAMPSEEELTFRP